MPKKHTIEYIKSYFKENGCVLLETEYIGSNTPMLYMCNCGNESTMSFANFQTGKRCMKCSGREKPTIEFVKQQFIDGGCELLEEVYLNNSTPMKYRCSCGRISKICFAHFKRGKRCRKCAGERISGEKHYKWNPNRKQVEKNDFWRKKTYSLIHHRLRRIGTKKEGHTHKLLGYSMIELMNHIESHPNYEKVKDNYQIDHIYPIKAFVKYGITDPKIICALDNLQPLSPYHNDSKNDKYDEDEFIQYCKQKEILKYYGNAPF